MTPTTPRKVPFVEVMGLKRALSQVVLFPVTEV